MKKITFKVKGSETEPYEVTFVKVSIDTLSAECNCKAAKNGQPCKHRISILDGNIKSIVNANIEDVQTIQSWLLGTNLEQSLNKVKELESELKRIQDKLSRSKKELAKIMRN